MIHKDVVVIGGGPGGYVAAIRAAQLGAKVALVEKDALGGTCVNRGCIPTKLLLHGGELLEQATKSREFGINVEKATIDFPKLMALKDDVVRGLVRGIETLMRSNSIEVLKGRGSLVSASEVKVEDADGHAQVTKAEKIILATGSVPSIPPIPGINSPGVMTSDEALRLSAIPRSVIIIGGGVIGVEFSNIFSKLGTKVTILEMMPQLIPGEDQELAVSLEKVLRRTGVEILTSAKVTAIQDEPGAGKSVMVTTLEGEKRVTGEVVLIAVGRKPNTEQLGLETAGVNTEKGKVLTDARMQTSVSGIYAIGDVTGGILLAHVASEQGIVAAENALGEESVMDYQVVPRCIYTAPEIAAVGMTEQQAKDKGHEIKVGRFPFAANAMAKILGQREGFAKIISEADSGKILGIHLFGHKVTELISEAALAMRMKATTHDIISTVHPHPTLSEAIREAALDAEGMVIHMPPRR